LHKMSWSSGVMDKGAQVVGVNTLLSVTPLNLQMATETAHRAQAINAGTINRNK
jgi:hypothetical protein